MAYNCRNSFIYGVRTLDTTLERKHDVRHWEPGKLHHERRSASEIRDAAAALAATPARRCERCRHEFHGTGPNCPECP